MSVIYDTRKGKEKKGKEKRPEIGKNKEIGMYTAKNEKMTGRYREK